MHIIMCAKGNIELYTLLCPCMDNIRITHRAHYGIYICKVRFYSDLRWLHTFKKNNTQIHSKNYRSVNYVLSFTALVNTDTVI